MVECITDKNFLFDNRLDLARRFALTVGFDLKKCEVAMQVLHFQLIDFATQIDEDDSGKYYLEFLDVASCLCHKLHKDKRATVLRRLNQKIDEIGTGNSNEYVASYRKSMRTGKTDKRANNTRFVFVFHEIILLITNLNPIWKLNWAFIVQMGQQVDFGLSNMFVYDI